MGLSGGARLDPLFEQHLLGGGEPLVRFRRRHHHGGVGGMNAGDQLARLRIARHNSAGSVAVGGGSLSRVEPQFGLPLGRIGAMAGEAVFRQDRQDVAIVPESCVGGCSRRGDQRTRPAEHQYPSYHRYRCPHHANNPFTTFPCTSVRRKSRPWKRYVSCV